MSYFKKMFIIFFSFLFRVILLMVLLIPLIILLVLTLLIDFHNPIFRQKRLGKNSKTFYIYKIKSMKNHIPTKWGAFLRRFKLDELLQVINLVNYTMNFIGPRPLTSIDHDEGLELIPEFNKRLVVKPGITGYQQVNSIKPGPNIRLEEDLITINNHNNIKFNIIIIWKTFLMIFNRKNR